MAEAEWFLSRDRFKVFWTCLVIVVLTFINRARLFLFKVLTQAKTLNVYTLPQ